MNCFLKIWMLWPVAEFLFISKWMSLFLYKLYLMWITKNKLPKDCNTNLYTIFFFVFLYLICIVFMYVTFRLILWLVSPISNQVFYLGTISISGMFLASYQFPLNIYHKAWKSMQLPWNSKISLKYDLLLIFVKDSV